MQYVQQTNQQEYFKQNSREDLSQEEFIKQLQNQLLDHQQQNVELQKQNNELIEINKQQIIKPLDPQKEYDAASYNYLQQVQNNDSQQQSNIQQTELIDFTQQDMMQNQEEKLRQQYPEKWQQQIVERHPSFKEHPDYMRAALNNQTRFHDILQLNQNHVLIECNEISYCQHQLEVISDKQLPVQLQGKITEEEWTQKIKTLNNFSNYKNTIGLLVITLIIFTIIPAFYRNEAGYVSSSLAIIAPFVYLLIGSLSWTFISWTFDTKFEKEIQEWLISFNKILEPQGCKIARDRYSYTTRSSARNRSHHKSHYRECFVIATQPQDIQPLVNAANSKKYSQGWDFYMKNEEFARY